MVTQRVLGRKRTTPAEKTAQDTKGEDSASPVTDLVLGPGIDSDVEKRVKKHAENFKTYFRRTVKEAWELGGALREAKKQVSHGQWLPWLKVQVRLEPRTVQRLMAFHERYPEMSLVSHLVSVSQALRTLPMPESDKKDGRDRADSGRTSPGETKQGKVGVTAPTGGGADAGGDRTTETVGGDLAAIVKQLELILQRTPREAAGQQESDLEALVQLTILAGTAVTTHLKLAAEDEKRPALTDVAVAKVADVLEGITKGRQNAQGKLTQSADDLNQRREMRRATGLATGRRAFALVLAGAKGT